MTGVTDGTFRDVALQRLADANVIGMISGAGDLVTAANDYFLDLIGYTRQELLRGEVDWRGLTPPEWAAADGRAYEQARTLGLSTAYEKEYVHRDGRRVPVLVGGAVLAAGTPIEYVSFVVDLSAQKAAEAVSRRALAAERAERSRLETLQQLSAALGRAADSQAVADTVVSTVTAGLGAQAASVGVFEQQGRAFRTLASARLPEEVIASITPRVPVAELPIAADVLATGRPVLVTSSDDRDRRYPEYEGTEVRQEAWANLPLVVEGKVVGVATFGWDAPRTFRPDEVELMEAVAGQCAFALHRALLLDRERSARHAAESAQQRLDLLARASGRFANARDEGELLASLASVLQSLADWVTVLVLDQQNRLVRRQVRIPDARLANALEGQVLDPLPPDDPRARALRSGRLVRLGHADVAPLLAEGDPELAERLGMHDLGHLLALPLSARGRALGVVVLWRTRSQPPFAADDTRLAEDVVSRAGPLLETLRTLAARTWIAAQLQASLLPEALPTTQELEFAARYVAAEESAEVGGDFYDAFTVGPGEFVVTIGDVSGRGVAAAGLTGLARSALHALPSEIGPADALVRLNAVLLDRTGPEAFLTAAYLRLRTGLGGAHAIVCSAGHPPPLLVRPDGSVRPVGEPGSLLGQLEEIALTEQTLELEPGDLLLLYTDGVIEAHGADGLFGEDRLLTIARTSAGGRASRLVKAVQRAVLDYRTGGSDDLAVIAVRVLPPADVPHAPPD